MMARNTHNQVILLDFVRVLADELEGSGHQGHLGFRENRAFLGQLRTVVTHCD